MSARAGAERWLMIHDELLHGLAHALSNRVATIDAAAYMLTLDDADAAQQAETLRGEAERLELLLHALRALPRRANVDAEPVMPADAVQGALTIHAHHGDYRDIPCDTVIDADVPPAFADPMALQHALLVALTTARRAAGAHGTATLRVTSHADVVQFAASGSAGASEGRGAIDAGMHDEIALDGTAIDWLLGQHGGRSSALQAGIAFTVPTLAAARRAEKRTER